MSSSKSTNHVLTAQRPSDMDGRKPKMPDTDTSDSQSKPSIHHGDGWLILLYLLLLVFSIGLVTLGMVGFGDEQANPVVLGLGFVAVILVASLYPIASALHTLLAAQQEDADRRHRMIELFSSINDRMLLSDAAKRIAYRAQDREALRQAIREDIDKQDYAAALALLDEMSQSYGYEHEAEEFRKEIEQASDASAAIMVNKALAELDAVLGQRRWDEAAHLASRIQRQFPRSQRVATLDKHVVDAREQYKLNLERRFLEANQRDDVELAMSLLKEMDRYLTPKEAEPFREIARGVISKKRQNLGVQFKLAIQDKEWSTALKAGLEIVQEFPNTKFADEVQDMMPLLRERAANESEQVASTDD